MRRILIRAGLLTCLSLFAPLLVGCEDDGLTPTSGFKPSECTNDPLCETGGRLDSGFGDTGVPPVNGDQDGGVPAGDGGAAVDSGDTDGGAAPDAGSPVDVGPGVDSGTIDDFLNLAGTYDTQYIFDWSNALFGISGLAGPLDFLDQAIEGNIDTGFPPLDALIAAVVQQFVPPWLATLISVLNDVANFFEEVEVRGVMNLSQSLPVQGPTGLVCNLSGTENWTTMWVYLISQCPLGRNDPNYPACARQQVNIVPATPNPVGAVDIEVDVKAFVGVLQPGRPAADFVLQSRDVDVDFYKLVRIILDLAINLATNGQIPTIQDGLNQAIDCAALEARAYSIATNFGLNSILATAAATAVRRTCDNEKQNAINAIIGGLNGIGIGLIGFEFDQAGHAVDTNGNQRPEKIQLLSVPNSIDGDIQVGFSASLAGRWEGTNRSP